MPLGAFRLNGLSKSIVAAGRTAVSVTVVGDAQVDTAQSKFGGASYLGDGSGDYLRCNSVDTFTGDFTIEGWFRFPSVADQPHLMSIDGAGTALAGISIWKDASTIKIYSNGANGSWSQIGGSVGTVTTNTWYHISVCRSGTAYYASLEGTVTSLGTFTGTISSSGDVVVGALTHTSTNSFNGHIDEVRVSSIARYTTGFTPSTSAFTNDADTLLLLHMDGADGSTTFTDDTG